MAQKMIKATKSARGSVFGRIKEEEFYNITQDFGSPNGHLKTLSVDFSKLSQRKTARESFLNSSFQSNNIH
jgi:hypothetical protein